MSILSNFSNLLRTRDELAKRIAHHKSQAALAVRALALADSLTKTLPEQIAEIEAEPVETHPSYEAEEFHGKGGLLAQLQATDALRRLLSDLPAVRKYWMNIQKENAETDAA